MSINKQTLIHEDIFDSDFLQESVIKGFSDEPVKFSCNLKVADPSQYTVELWANISGREHGYELLYQSSNEYFSKELSLESGFYDCYFRCKKKDNLHWVWSRKFTLMIDPGYLRDAIVYNGFIRFFGHEPHGGNPKFASSGTFGDLKKRLQEVKDLGCDILYLNPVHPIGELYRNYNPHDFYPSYLQPGCPYSIKDYKALDPELGINKDLRHGSTTDPFTEFKALVDEAHKYGIKVFMDLVFNHTSHDFVFQRLHPEWFLYKDDITSLDDPYIHPHELKIGKPWGDRKHTFCPFDHGMWWKDAAQLNWEYKIPKASNDPPSNPTLGEMYEYFKSIPKYWVEKVGIDGFRCDVAYRIPPKFWRECISETRSFAKKSKSNLSGDVVFVAESFNDDIGLLFECGFSAVYGDFSNKLWSPLTLKGYVDYMLGNEVPKNSLFWLFSECHDFHRTQKKILKSPDELLGERVNKSRYVLTATLPGVPMIFNGFEKLEWEQVNLFSYSSINWESDNDLKDYIRKINEIRSNSKSLAKGSYTYIDTNQPLENRQVYAFLRALDDELVLVCVNMDVYHKATPTLHLPFDFDLNYSLKDLVSGEIFERTSNNLYIELEPGESHIFRIEK